MSTDVPKAELVRWLRRYEAVERRIDAERVAHPPSPGEAFDRAAALRAFAEELGVLNRSGMPSEEDLLVYRTWDRIRRVLLGPHA